MAEPPHGTVLPTQLRAGNRFTDEEGEWDVAGHPGNIHSAKTVHVRVQRLGDPGTKREKSWPAARASHRHAGDIVMAATSREQRRSLLATALGFRQCDHWNEQLIAGRRAARTITRDGRTTLSPLVFHRAGAPLGGFRKAWSTVCTVLQRTVHRSLWVVVRPFSRENLLGAGKCDPSTIAHPVAEFVGSGEALPTLPAATFTVMIARSPEPTILASEPDLACRAFRHTFS